MVRKKGPRKRNMLDGDEALKILLVPTRLLIKPLHFLPGYGFWKAMQTGDVSLVLLLAK